MIVTKDFESPEELAMFSKDMSAVVLVVGAKKECEALAEELEGMVVSTEKIVHLETDARLFDAMERPTACPAVGVWSSKGSLVGYREQGESIAEFLEYARTFC